jgi:hypothetical protein
MTTPTMPSRSSSLPATCLQSAIGTTIVKGFTPARNVTGGHPADELNAALAAG